MKNTKFFEKTTGFDRESFQNKLKEAIEIIAKNRSVVAKRVLKAIKEKKFLIHAFFDVSKAHYPSIVSMMQAYKVNFPTTFPPDFNTVMLMEKELDGFIHNGKYIYLASKNSSKEMACTLVHEVTHYFNKHLLKLDKKKNGLTNHDYQDEVMAYTAEVVFEKNGFCLLRSDVKKIHDFINADYPDIAVKSNYARLGYIQGFYDRLKDLDSMEQENVPSTVLRTVQEVEKTIAPEEYFIPDKRYSCVLF